MGPLLLLDHDVPPSLRSPCCASPVLTTAKLGYGYGYDYEVDFSVDVSVLDLELEPLPSSSDHHYQHHSRSAPARWAQLRSFVQQLTGLEGSPHARAHQHLTNPGRRRLRHRLLLHPDFWLEAIDPHHRYGYHLRAFHQRWQQVMEAYDRPDPQAIEDTENPSSVDMDGKTRQYQRDQERSFFYWLDVGRGATESVPECATRFLLWTTRVLYCRERERQHHEVTVATGSESDRSSESESNPGSNSNVLVFQQNRTLVHTDSSSKWMFVLGVDARMYVGRKEKGRFHHTSFHGGAPIASAGKIRVQHGKIVSVEPHSGHFKPRLMHLLQMYRELAARGIDAAEICFVKPRKWTDDWPFDPETGKMEMAMQQRLGFMH